MNHDLHRNCTVYFEHPNQSGLFDDILLDLVILGVCLAKTDVGLEKLDVNAAALYLLCLKLITELTYISDSLCSVHNRD